MNALRMKFNDHERARTGAEQKGTCNIHFRMDLVLVMFLCFFCRHRTDLGEGEERRNVGPGSWQRCSVLASVEKVVSKRLLALVLAHIKWWLWKSATELHYKGTLKPTRTQDLDILRREGGCGAAFAA